MAANDQDKDDKPIKTLSEEDIRLLKTYGAGPYASRIKKLEGDIKVGTLPGSAHVPACSWGGGVGGRCTPCRDHANMERTLSCKGAIGTQQGMAAGRAVPICRQQAAASLGRCFLGPGSPARLACAQRAVRKDLCSRRWQVPGLTSVPMQANPLWELRGNLRI